VTWGVTKVEANMAWSALDVTGEGVAVANTHTGLACARQSRPLRYRGDSGGPALDHLHNR